MAGTEANRAENPFASPQDSGQKLSAIVPIRREGLDGSATLVSEGLLYRKVQIHAPIEATIEYIGRGLRDRILVNGKLVYWRLPIMGLSAVFEFPVETKSGPVSAKIIVEVGKMLQMRRFQIILDQRSVYVEEQEKR